VIRLLPTRLRPRRGSVTVILVAGVLSFGGGSATRAQDPDPLSKLENNSRFMVELLIDSAETAGLPTRPLVSTALEGISRHIDSRKIVEAVKKELGLLRVARAELGPVGEQELTAAASVLQAGAKPDQLRAFRARQRGRSDLAAFTYWADLISRGVPGEDAYAAINTLWQNGADDVTFYGLWRSVTADILQGLSPGTALQNRIRETPGRTSSPQVKPPPEGQQENQRST
jgi:hypothetical protein